MSISSPSTSHFEIGCTSACPSFFSFGGIVIDKKLIKQDIRSLFLLYISLNTTSLETFRDLWYERGFSLIHYICTQRDSKDLFLEYIYSVILSYFLVSPTSCGRAGVVYALYLLRESEPLKGSISQTHIPIPIINTVMYNELKESYQVFSTEGLIEPLLVLRYLFKNDAFGYIQNRSTLFDIEDSGSDLSQNLLSPTTLDDPRYFDDNLLVVETSDVEFFETSGAMYTLLKKELATLVPTGELPHELALFDSSLVCKLRLLKKSDQ